VVLCLKSVSHASSADHQANDFQECWVIMLETPFVDVCFDLFPKNKNMYHFGCGFSVVHDFTLPNGLVSRVAMAVVLGHSPGHSRAPNCSCQITGSFTIEYV
jgi:hypothetical protein